jgi:hypothetical protein
MRFLSFCVVGSGRGMSCEVRRLKNRRVGDSSGASSSLEVSSSRRTARRFVSVRVLHLSEPPEWPPILPPPRNSPAILLKNPPLVFRSRSDAECDIERRGGTSVMEDGWLNDPVPVPVPLLVLLPLTSRERGGRRERRRPTLALVAGVANRAFSTTSTGRESSSLEPCSQSSGSSFMGPLSVEGSANSEIACAGGI